jgi:2-methylisocitrate lyase-like PEP mutase family enzyme
MGFKIASFSGSIQKVAIKAIERFLVDFRRTGDINFYIEEMVSLKERSSLLELDDFYKLEKKYGRPSGK